MNNYNIWSCDGQMMVEVFNSDDINSVQKIFIEKGCIIIDICRGVFNNSTFMRVEIVKEND